MKQEEKDLLIKDLSARVFYGVVCQCNPIEQIENLKSSFVKMKNYTDKKKKERETTKWQQL